MSRLRIEINNDGKKDMVPADYALSSPEGGRLNQWRND